MNNPLDDTFQYSRLFNTSVKFSIPKTDETVSGIIEGWAIHTDDEGKTYFSNEIIVRVDPRTFTKQGRKYFTQFMCLNPNGTTSCLYVIPKEIVRQNVEGEITQTTSKRIKRE